MPDKPSTTNAVEEQRPLVLLVDDNQDVRMGSRLLLELAGYRVEEVANGREALERLRRLPAVCVLLDLFMPNGNGWEFLTAKNADPVLGPVPVVIYSAYPQRNGMSPGVAAVLQKPGNPEELVAAVTVAVTGKKP